MYRLKAEDFAHDVKLKAENLGQEAKQKGISLSEALTQPLEGVRSEKSNYTPPNIIWRVPSVGLLPVVLLTLP